MVKKITLANQPTVYKEGRWIFRGHDYNDEVVRTVSDARSRFFGSSGRLWMPNLVRLEIDCTDLLGSSEDIMHFLTPTLRRIKIPKACLQNPPSLAAETFLSTLMEKCPIMQELVIVDIRPRISPSPITLSSTFGDIRNLREIVFPRKSSQIDLEIIMHLAYLPNLVMLECGANPLQDVSVVQGVESSSQPFPSLQSLRFQSSWTVFDSIIRKYLFGSKLKTMVFESTDQLSIRAFDTIFSQISRCISADSLTTFRIEEHCTLDTTESLTSQLFSPLFKFINMEMFVVRGDFLVGELSNDLLEAISLAWPRLRKLFLWPTIATSINYSNFTLKGLWYLARGCTALQELALTFYFTSMQSAGDISTGVSWRPGRVLCTHDRPGGGASCPSLREFHVGESPVEVECRLDIASFLSDVFPEAAIDTIWDEEEPVDEEEKQNKENWENVVALFQAFGDIRRQERSWVTDSDGQSSRISRLYIGSAGSPSVSDSALP